MMGNKNGDPEERRMISMKGAKTKQPHFEEMGLLPMSASKKPLQLA